MTRMSESLERTMREKVRESAATMRRYADEMERAAEYHDATHVPATAVQVFVNLAMNVRLDLPATYLGELLKVERAETEIAERERLGSDNG